MVIFGNATVSLVGPMTVEQNQCNVKLPMFVEKPGMTAMELSEVEAKVWERIQEFWWSSPSGASGLASFYNDWWDSCELGVPVPGSTLGGSAVYQVWESPVCVCWAFG